MLIFHMAAFRFQVRYGGQYFNGVANGSGAEEAGQNFAELLKANKIKPLTESVYRPDRLYVTYEEINIGERNENPSEEDPTRV